MWFSSQNCLGAQSGTTGREYKTDKDGFITVHDDDVQSFKDGGYMPVGGMPKFKRYFVCDDCSWDASINHCPKCGSEDLRKVQR